MKKFACANSFAAAVQQKAGQHEQRQGEQQGFQKQQGNKDGSRNGVILEDNIGEAGQAAQNIDGEKVDKKAPAPSVHSGKDKREPQTDGAEQKGGTEYGEIQRFNPVVHAFVPPAENGIWSFFSCLRMLSGVSGLTRKPLASVSHALREYSG